MVLCWQLKINSEVYAFLSKFASQENNKKQSVNGRISVSKITKEIKINITTFFLNQGFVNKSIRLIWY